jgi:hypothetical protein
MSGKLTRSHCKSGQPTVSRMMADWAHDAWLEGILNNWEKVKS